MKNKKPYFIIDFDSTFIRTEGLERLAEIALSQSPIKQQLLKELEHLTDLGMEGKIDFRESLERRLRLFQPTRSQLEQLVKELQDEITPSFEKNIEFFQKHQENIYIISGGFKEWIVPVVEKFGIKSEHVVANTFTFDEYGTVTGFDKDNPLSASKGKPQVVDKLGLDGEVYIIGDGYTDFEIKRGLDNFKFCVFTENKKREEILPLADYVLPNLDELLFTLDLPRANSYPKNRIKVLLLERVSDTAVNEFANEGYAVEYIDHALSEEELKKKIKDVSILGIRSKTQVTKNILDQANKLLAIGAFCVGTNQIETQYAAKQGVTIFNAPFSNTRSVAELAIGLIISLNRGLVDKACKMRNGQWDRTIHNYHELRGQKLGIIGYGNIGTQLSILAEAIGMEVSYFDLEDKQTLGNATQSASLEELLSTCDIISLHVDGGKSNQHIIGEDEFSQMKKGAIFLNLTRGHIVDNKALKTALDSGRLAGAAIDAFEDEPDSHQASFSHPLQNYDNVVLTPHIGASTQEAQANIGRFVAKKVIKYINTGETKLSTNMPSIRANFVEDHHRLMLIHQNVPGVLAKVNSILADNDTNIIYQRLDTKDTIGYLITDIATDYNKSVIAKLKKLDTTISLRILF